MNFWEGALIGYLLGSNSSERRKNPDDPEYPDGSGVSIFALITALCIAGYIFGGEIIKTLSVVFYLSYLVIGIIYILLKIISFFKKNH